MDLMEGLFIYEELNDFDDDLISCGFLKDPFELDPTAIPI